MIKRYNNMSLTFGIPGIILQVIGNFLFRASEGGIVTILAIPIALAGTALLITGFAYYAVGKGHSGWWGLCGLLSCIGLLILALLPDQRPHG